MLYEPLRLTRRNGKISFLDCLVTRDNNKLKTTSYRKPSHTNRLPDQSSYNPTSHKATTIRTLTRRAQLLCDSPDSLQDETNYLNNVFSNKYNYNTLLWKEEEHLNLIKATIYQTKSEYQSDNSVNPALLWDMIKMKVREKSIAYAAAKNYKTKSHKDILHKEISGLEKELDENTALSDTQKSLLQSKLDNLRSDMEEIIEYRTRGAILRSRIRWHNEGEKNTKYFLNLEKRQLQTGNNWSLKEK